MPRPPFTPLSHLPHIHGLIVRHIMGAAKHGLLDEEAGDGVGDGDGTGGTHNDEEDDYGGGEGRRHCCCFLLWSWLVGLVESVLLSVFGGAWLHGMLEGQVWDDWIEHDDGVEWTRFRDCADGLWSRERCRVE